MKKNILVFPCGSEIGLEIHRSLKYARHFNLIGANSVDDHGKFVYENYFGGLPFVGDPQLIPAINRIIEEQKIDLIFPAMDSVITEFCSRRNEINCTVIGSPAETTEIFLSKIKTYDFFEKIIPIPKVYNNVEEVAEFPVFLKPEIGYSSRGTKKATNIKQAQQHLQELPGCMILEYLPGKEYTVDCFTNEDRNLLFYGPRVRQRISNGISVNTTAVIDVDAQRQIQEFANKINNSITIRGAWFFQLKEDCNGKLKLMEVAARLGGSSSLFRAQGINFALMAVWDALGTKVVAMPNSYKTEMDRALTSRFKTNLIYDRVYVDLDDTLIIDGKINTELIAFLYQAFNQKKKLILISRHKYDLPQTLSNYRLSNLFDEIIHLKNGEQKSDYIIPQNSILIDDSFAERYSVQSNLGLPAIAPDAVECLIEK